MIKHKLVILFITFSVFSSCKSSHLNESVAPAVGMIKVSILYPNEKGATFDMEYYEKSHMPMMAGILGKNLKFYEIDKGIAGRTPNDETPFIAIGYFYCAGLAEYNKAIQQNINTIVNDIKKYTNVQPTIQISEIRQLRRL